MATMGAQDHLPKQESDLLRDIKVGFRQDVRVELIGVRHNDQE